MLYGFHPGKMQINFLRWIAFPCNMETAPRFGGNSGVQPWVGATGWNQTLIPRFVHLLLQPMANTWPALRAVLPSNEIKYKFHTRISFPVIANPLLRWISFPELNPPQNGSHAINGFHPGKNANLIHRSDLIPGLNPPRSGVH